MSNLKPVSKVTTASIEASEAPSLKSRLLWHNIAFMVITPILAAVATPVYLYHYGSTWGLWAFFAVCFIINNMSITCGYHRYFSHRSYDVHPIVEWLYIFLASGTFQGTLLQWCTDHRRHHREIDTEMDPYNINQGFWYAHLFWMFKTDDSPEATNYAKDLLKNRWVVFQHKYYAPIAFLVGFGLPSLVGWALGFGWTGGFIIGGALRIVLCQHSTFLINSMAHSFGKQTYTDKHTARDSLFCALLTFGEGYHNFHHSFQADYRNGTRWYHWDPTKWSIQLMATVGLATRLKQAQKEEILKARLAMEERLMISKGACADRVQHLKSRIVEAQNKVKHLRESYRATKAEWALKGRQWQRLMRAEIRMAEIEFQSAYGQWRTFRRAVKNKAIAA